MTRRPAARSGAFALERIDAGLIDEWDRLAVATGAAPFLRPGWICAWADSFATRDALRVATIRHDGRVGALLPMMSRRGVLSGPTNNETPVLDVLSDYPDGERELIDRLLETDCRRVDLSFLPGEGPVSGTWGSASQSTRRCTQAWTLRNSPYVAVTSRWDDYQSLLSGSHRREIRRLERRVTGAGSAEFTVRDGQQDLDHLLRDAFAVEARSWKGAAGTAILSTPAVTSFYQSVARWAMRDGILRLAFLTLDGWPVSFCLCFAQTGRLYCVKAGHDPDFRTLAPGVVLLHRLIQYACADQTITTIELLGENEDYKARLSHGVREQVRLIAFRRTPFGFADCLHIRGEQLLRRAARRHLPVDVRVRAHTRYRQLRTLL